MSFKVGDRVRSSNFPSVIVEVRKLSKNGEYLYGPDEGDHEWCLNTEACELVGEPSSDFESALDEILAEIRELMIGRHAKYGPGNILRHGEMGVVVRLGDKYERLDHSREVEFADEAIDDTVMDICGYSLIMMLLRRGRWPGQSDAQ